MKNLNLLFATIFALLVLIASGVSAQGEEHESTSIIYIKEVSTSSIESKSEEFIEISLSSVHSHDLEIYYQPKSSDKWYKKAEFFTVPGFGEILFSTSIDQPGLSSGLSDIGGRLIVVADGLEVDRVEWSSLSSQGNSLKRIFNEDNEPLSCLANDCHVLNESEFPTPYDSFIEYLGQEMNPDEKSDPQGGDDPTDTVNEGTTIDGGDGVGSGGDLMPAEPISPDSSIDGLLVTEIFPNPKSPQVDSRDEFIELYNSSNSAISLSGAEIKTGSKANKIERTDQVILPGNFLVLYSRDSNISLVNGGGEIIIISSLGEQYVVTYPKGEEGLSYQLVSGEWVWRSPSPGQHNSNNDMGQDTEISFGSSNPVMNFAQVKSAATSAQQENHSHQQANNEQIDFIVLATVGAFTVFYLLYEYRVEISSGVQKLKSNLRIGKKNRPEV